VHIGRVAGGTSAAKITPRLLDWRRPSCVGNRTCRPSSQSMPGRNSPQMPDEQSDRMGEATVPGVNLSTIENRRAFGAPTRRPRAATPSIRGRARRDSRPRAARACPLQQMEVEIADVGRNAYGSRQRVGAVPRTRRESYTRAQLRFGSSASHSIRGSKLRLRRRRAEYARRAHSGR